MLASLKRGKVEMTVFIIALLIFFVAFGAYSYYGGLAKIHMKVEDLGGEMIVYKEVKGDYKQTKPVTDEVYNYLLNELKIETYKGIGIFYDDPKIVAKEQLRSEIGCVIESKDIERLNENNCTYAIKTLPVKSAIVTELPFKGLISILIGIVKVYPAIRKYIDEHNLANGGYLVEVYDIPNQKTVYRKILE